VTTSAARQGWREKCLGTRGTTGEKSFRPGGIFASFGAKCFCVMHFLQFYSFFLRLGKEREKKEITRDRQQGEGERGKGNWNGNWQLG